MIKLSSKFNKNKIQFYEREDYEMKKKFIFVLLAIGLIATLITGCNQTTSPDLGEGETDWPKETVTMKIVKKK